MDRYIVVTWHGDPYSLFHIVDTSRPTEEQPAVVASFHDKRNAENWKRVYGLKDPIFQHTLG